MRQRGGSAGRKVTPCGGRDLTNRMRSTGVEWSSRGGGGERVRPAGEDSSIGSQARRSGRAGRVVGRSRVERSGRGPRSVNHAVHRTSGRALRARAGAPQGPCAMKRDRTGQDSLTPSASLARQRHPSRPLPCRCGGL